MIGAKATADPVIQLAARLSVDEAATRCGVSKFTVRSWLRQRRIPFFKLGRRVVLDAADVDAFLRAHRVEARDEAGR
jgi:excisionase family DNA binding protein